MGRQMDKELHRCKVITSITCDDPEYGRVMGIGQAVDLAESIGVNSKGKPVILGDLVRPGCFEKITQAKKDPSPKKRGNK